MLVVKDLSKSFGTVKAVNNVSFFIKNGGVTALLGPNGAGKTTLLRLISGFYMSDSGKVLINNYDINENRISALKGFAYVPENGALYLEMTVAEYIKFIAKIHNLAENEFKYNFKQICNELGLNDVINRKCEELSKGYRRRVALAGALIHRPHILVLDEPTEGLDPNQKFVIRKFLREYGKHNTVLISTHIMEDVESVSDRVLLMNKGKLICDTTTVSLKGSTSDNSIETAFRSITFEKGEI